MCPRPANSGQPRLAQGEGRLGRTGSARSLAEEDIVRLIVDGTVVKTRIDEKATNITVLAAIGVRRDGQKVLLAIRNMGGESKAAWSAFLGDLDARGLRRPAFVVADGAPGLEAALTALWGEDLPIQRCTVHKHRNLLAHAPRECQKFRAVGMTGRGRRPWHGTTQSALDPGRASGPAAGRA